MTYRVQPVLAPNCFGSPVDVIITIRPQPVVVPGQIKTLSVQVSQSEKRSFLFLPIHLQALSSTGVLPVMSDASVQGTAGVNVAADPAGTIHINDAIK